MKLLLEIMRQAAEKLCKVRNLASDRDSADAWERIGVRIDNALHDSMADFRVIEANQGQYAQEYALVETQYLLDKAMKAKNTI